MSKFIYTKSEIDKVVLKLENIRSRILEVTVIVLDENRLFTKGLNFVEHNLPVLQNLQSDMDDALNDFYHILGMVKLSAAAIARITSRVIKMLEVRSDLKRSISALQTYKSLIGQMTSKPSEYKIKTLGDKKTIRVE